MTVVGASTHARACVRVLCFFLTLTPATSTTTVSSASSSASEVINYSAEDVSFGALYLGDEVSFPSSERGLQGQGTREILPGSSSPSKEKLAAT